ncbi:hypothetical protein VH441_09040 [Psychrobacter sp. HD31]|uniref:hypothetical protein n=1 Tax=Psychrobacter sp. HD31 TaxID=3112003 RepID=UPI003DA613A6
MSGTRKILIVENGFDLAHFLPTKYEHFIHAMKVVDNYNAPKNSFLMIFRNLVGTDFTIKKPIQF